MRLAAFGLALALSSIACVMPAEEVDGDDDPIEGDESAIGTKPKEGSPEALAILALVNDRGTTAAKLRAATRLSTRVVNGIVAHRDGKDATFGTNDDDLYDDLAELDAVPWVGPTTLKRLLDVAARDGWLADQKAKQLSVVFSPQPADRSHNVEVAKTFAAAKRSIDVLIYSLSDAAVVQALSDAAARGVKVRVIYDGASEDRKLTGSALAATRSGQLEAKGVDVRWVNKIMHHKLAIVDGPRDDVSLAKTAKIVTGSGNWSNGAATRYDENTLFLRGYPEIALRLQREFDLLWAHSRELGASRPTDVRATPIASEQIPEDPTTHAWFTSANFTPKGDTFFTNNGNEVSDVLVAAIRSATKSIHVASGHLRSRPIAEALIEKRKADPAIDIKVLLDGQEYISKSAHAAQQKELSACLAAAGASEAKKRDCLDKGFLFGLQVGEAGIAVRYKYYAYRWDVSYAKQMHHKYMVIDGSWLLTGSYNLSDNAEHDTFENVLSFRGPEFTALVASYEANFGKLWELRRAENALEALRHVVGSGATIPLVFEPLTLDWSEITALKAHIRASCSEVDSEPFRKDPVAHQTCAR